MTRTPLLLMLAATAALAGCKPNTIGADNAAENATNTAANANVQLPPMSLATKLYRCADNSVVTVDYLSDGKSANVKIGDSGEPVTVTAAETGKPMASADGAYSVEGSATAASAKIAVPGHPAQTCKA